MATVLVTVITLLFVLALIALAVWYFADNVTEENRSGWLKFFFQTVGVCLLLWVVAELIN